jgi:hypothetical protein
MSKWRTNRNGDANWWWLAACGGVWIVFSCASLGGERFSIPKSAISSGGGPSSGGRFELRGTAGQPLASLSKGGRYQVASGFWPVQTLPLPNLEIVLTIQAVGDSIIVSWPSTSQEYILEFSPSLKAPQVWQRVEGIIGLDVPCRVTLPTEGSSAAGFLRLRRK